MDPDQALAALRELMPLTSDATIAAMAAEQFEALDQWLTRGGFLPQAWSGAPRCEHYASEELYCLTCRDSIGTDLTKPAGSYQPRHAGG